MSEACAKSHFSVANSFVIFIGNVSTDHVIEEDSQGPDGGLFPMVARASDPLRGSVDSGTCKIIRKMKLTVLE